MYSKDKTLLAIDTTTELCSVALLYQGEISSKSMIAPREHANQILPMVDHLLTQAGIQLNVVDTLIYGRGPGSFTGLRICLGVAQGLAYGADLPMIGVSTLAALAQQTLRVYSKTQVYCGIDARMNELYFAGFSYGGAQQNFWQLITPEQVIAPEEVTLAIDSEFVFSGTGWTAYQDQYQETARIQKNRMEVLYPMAEDLISLVLHDQSELSLPYLTKTTAALASPVYLRNTVAWQKLPGRH